MEHKKTLFEPLQDIGYILKAQWGESVIWATKILSNPSPMVFLKGGWTFLAGILIWQGVKKIIIHRQLTTID
jgi:hypothetical protein